jgi:hypothetical protein
LSNNDDFGLIIFMEKPLAIPKFVEHDETRFRIIRMGNFPATKSIEKEYDFCVGKNIRILGNNYEIRRSTVVLPGDNEPDVGVAMDTMLMRCPMQLSRREPTYHPCDQLIKVILDFLPSVWICPKCSGLIIIDDTLDARKYYNADNANDFSYENQVLALYYYFGPHDWGDINFIDWATNEIGVHVFAVADAYQDYMGIRSITPTRPIRMRTLEDINTVDKLFGHLIS